MTILTRTSHFFQNLDTPQPKKKSVTMRNRILLSCAALLVVKTDAFSIHPAVSSVVTKTRSYSPLPLKAVSVDSAIETCDDTVLPRVVRVGNHAPALASLSYFGLISMASMMPDMHATLKPTLSSVLTKNVGSTTNAMFSAFFPTLVTPPSFIFLVWPLISLVQLTTILWSALRPSKPLLSQDVLTSLSLANLASSTWLLVASGSSQGALPLKAVLVLPLVPLLSGYPLRKLVTEPKKPKLETFAFQLYSGFTTLASILALTVELQHGGRVPLVGGQAEICALVFLAFYNYVLGWSEGVVRRSVNAAAICGILLKRLGGGWSVLTSPSLYGTAYVAWKAVKKLLDK